MRSKIFVILLALSLSATALAQGAPAVVVLRPASQRLRQTSAALLPKVAIRESDTPLQLGNGIYHFVARTHRIERSGEETTEWWELRDASGAVVSRQAYGVALTPDGFDTTELVEPRIFTTKLGSGVLVEGMSLPSAPGTGSWVQLFGFKWGPTKAGSLTAFGPPISIEGELLDIGTDPRRQAPPPMPGRTVMVMNDILRFRVWTGNFSIVYPVLINWITGKVEPSWHCRRATSGGQVDRCDYPLQEAAPLPRQERSFVRLFPEPDEGFTPSHIVVEPESKVELLKAEVPISWSQDANNICFGITADTDIWLRVRIDGHEGWIHTQEDFLAIGLPQAG